ncbi:MAG: hypothetical protein IPG45_05835 [Deltaproteobacteria bacterium]|nr:hypothetical protein [Deltaproteobacteria bacterium]
MQQHHRFQWLLVGALFPLACGPGDGSTPFAPENTQPGPQPTFTPLAAVTRLGSARSEAARPATRAEGPTARLSRAPRGGNAPNVGARLFSNSGAFTFPNGTSPGVAHADLAPVIDSQSGTIPGVLGSGGWDLNVAGTQYTESTAESVAEVFVDDTGTPYLVVSAFKLVMDPLTGAEIGTVVHVIVPSSEFGVGATVNFDGNERLALFATGDLSLPDPSVAAAAATGSVTFTAGSLAVGDIVTFTLSGDFGEIAWQTQPPPPPPPPPVGNIVAGNYTLSFDPNLYVQCDGTLAGQDAAFAALTLANVGFSDGPITVTSLAVDQLELSGAAISAAYGPTPFLVAASIDAPPGTYFGMSELNQIGAGPLGTDLAAAYLLLDDANASLAGVPGQAGLFFMTPDTMGYCSVDFGAALLP